MCAFARLGSVPVARVAALGCRPDDRQVAAGVGVVACRYGARNWWSAVHHRDSYAGALVQRGGPSCIARRVSRCGSCQPQELTARLGREVGGFSVEARATRLDVLRARAGTCPLHHVAHRLPDRRRPLALGVGSCGPNPARCGWWRKRRTSTPGPVRPLLPARPNVARESSDVCPRGLVRHLD